MKERKSNIELLRIYAFFGVIILHYNNSMGGAAFESVQYGSVNQIVLYILQSFAICSVDLFILISGYFLCKRNYRKTSRIFELFIQIILFSLATYLLNLILGRKIFSLKELLVHIVPNNYFVVLYSVVFIISPFINIMLNNLRDKQKRMLLTICILVFSVYPTCVDVLRDFTQMEWFGLSSIGMYGSQAGYTIVNFILLYIIGACLRDCQFKIKEYSKKKYVLILMICVSLIMCWSYANDYYGYMFEKSAYVYHNPIIILEAVVILLLFEKMNIKNNRIINLFANAGFTVFLLNNLFFPYLKIGLFVGKNTVIMLLHIFVSCMLIYLSCFVIFIIYSYITKPIYRLLYKHLKFPIIQAEDILGEKDEQS